MKKFILTLSILSITTVLAQTQLQKIDPNAQAPKPLKVFEEQKEVHMIEKKPRKVRYDKSTQVYSLFNLNKELFKEEMLSSGYSKFKLKKYLGTDESVTSVKLSAFLYDWVMKRPDIAENFYIWLRNKIDKNKEIKDSGDKPPENFRVNSKTKLYMSDYHIRTGRPDLVNPYLKSIDCLLMGKSDRKKCYYYKGLAKYLLEGDNKNKYIRMVKRDIKKANLIYKGEI